MSGQQAQPEQMPEMDDEGFGRCKDCANCIDRRCTKPRAAFGYKPREGRIELGRDFASLWQRCPAYRQMG